jgi:hypothetical protein
MARSRPVIGIKCLPIIPGHPAPHMSTQPWWWWIAAGVFSGYMLVKYGGPLPLLTLGPVMGALVMLPPIVRLVRAWNGERIDQTTECRVVGTSPDGDVILQQCRPDKWL